MAMVFIATTACAQKQSKYFKYEETSSKRIFLNYIDNLPIEKGYTSAVLNPSEYFQKYLCAVTKPFSEWLTQEQIEVLRSNYTMVIVDFNTSGGVSRVKFLIKPDVLEIVTEKILYDCSKELMQMQLDTTKWGSIEYPPNKDKVYLPLHFPLILNQTACNKFEKE